ncbi:MAG: MFS transporter, partial [Dehalococcoidia bacterium]|nr:MFS transporter [Dehalococcoidia bacterium]
LAFVVYWAFQNIGRIEGDDTARPDPREQLRLTRQVLKSPALWAINFVVGLRGMAYIAFITFLPIYLKDELGLDSRGVGVHIGLLTLIGIVATPAMGYLSDRLGRKLVLVPGMLWLSALSLLLVVYGDGVMLTVILVLLGLFLYSDQPILTAAALDIVGRNVATTTLGVLSFTRFALSASSPLIAGYLSETYGMDAVFRYAAALFAVAAVALTVIKMTPDTPSVEGNARGHHAAH